MLLDKLLQHENIAIQCHNIPDADAIAAGFGLYRYLVEKNKKPFLFYSGPPITKPNLLAMILQLQIPIEHAPDLKEWDGLLITVDCQYGMGNVGKVEAPHVAVIDHHLQERELPEVCELRPWLGACSTLVWDLLEKENFVFDLPLSTALVYGLFMDTNNFSELKHPLDKDMWDALKVDEGIFKQLRLSNLSLNDLLQTSSSLTELNVINEALRLALVPVPMCDPNLLGVIGDLVIQVDSIDTVVAYSPLPSGDLKFSVRTTTRDTKASDLAQWLADDLGSGGGHKEKAGGYIAYSKFVAKYTDKSLAAYCEERLRSYYERVRLIDCLDPHTFAGWPKPENCFLYRKLATSQGFLPTTQVFAEGVTLHIRTLEGDVLVKSSKDTYLMIGILGEVYPIERKVFEASYNVVDEEYAPQMEYFPTVLNTETGMRTSLAQYARACKATATKVVQAYVLGPSEYVKIFTAWDSENYYSGGPGDSVVVQSAHDLYVVRADVFSQTYARDFTREQLETMPHAQKICSVGLVGHDEQDAIAWALQPQEPFCVEVTQGGDAVSILLGAKEDWLVQDAKGFFEVLSPQLFQQKYARVS